MVSVIPKSRKGKKQFEGIVIVVNAGSTPAYPPKEV